MSRGLGDVYKRQIIVHTNNGTSVKIIENGYFVLPGTEELNKALGVY